MKYVSSFCIAICLHVSYALSAQDLLSLADALKIARESNTELKSGKLNIKIAQSDLTTAKLRPNPILNNQSLQLINSKFYPINTEWHHPANRQVWWQLTKQFQWPHLRQNKMEVATQQIALSENIYNESEHDLTFEVANQWLEVWRLKQLLTILQQAHFNLDSLVTIQKKRVENKMISATELIRTQIPLEQYSLQLKSTQLDYRSAVQELKFMLSSPDSVDVSTANSIETISITNQTDSLLAIALRMRPEIRTIQSTIAVSESNIKLQNSLKWPVPELGVIWNPQNTIPYLGFFGTIQLPFFSRNQGAIQKSIFIKQQAQLNFQTLQLKVKKEVATAYQAYQLQKETVSRYATILQMSTEVLRSDRHSYLKGETTLIELLEAERSWFDTQQLYYDAQSTYYQSYVRLLYATGLIIQL